MNAPRIIGDTFITPPANFLDVEGGFHFHDGTVLSPFRIAYETFGTLNEARSNAILVCHALSASAHAAGKYTEGDEKSGWWDGLIGYGKGIDLNRYFVVCVNFPGSCHGTTAPDSIDPRTNKPYGSRYPWITIEDMVVSQKLVLDHLGIRKLLSVAGGSLGGMQVLMWAALHPEMAGSIIAMAAGAAVPVPGIAWHIIGRKIIESDTRFNGGDYYDNPEPLRGLQVARMVGHMTYLSAEALERKFGRRRRKPTSQFEIDSYLEYQGRKFSAAYDANSYIRIQAAMDEMDLAEEHGSLELAFRDFRSPSLLVSFNTDWLFPPKEVRKVATALEVVGSDTTYLEMQSDNGHDTFLIDYVMITPPVSNFLDKINPQSHRSVAQKRI